jgi:hydrogenase maturation protease
MTQEPGPGSRTLVIGIGNPGRGDDGLGPALIELLRGSGLEGIALDANYQLNVEDALACSHFDTVIFIDASEAGDEPFAIAPLEPARDIAFTTHELSPASVLALCEDLYGRRPEAWLLAVRGFAWELGEGLSPRAAANLESAFAFLLKKLGSAPHRTRSGSDAEGV